MKAAYVLEGTEEEIIERFIAALAKHLGGYFVPLRYDEKHDAIYDQHNAERNRQWINHANKEARHNKALLTQKAEDLLNEISGTPVPRRSLTTNE